MECPICFNQINTSVTGLCSHHFCYSCLLKWCELGGTRCPICNLLITQIRRDMEFDKLIKLINIPSISESDISISIISELENTITLTLKRAEKPGITLVNNYSVTGERAPGVIISSLIEKDMCYKSGLRRRDIIISINNVPCIEHTSAIDIINKCSQSNTRMVFSLINSKYK